MFAPKVVARLPAEFAVRKTLSTTSGTEPVREPTGVELQLFAVFQLELTEPSQYQELIVAVSTPSRRLVAVVSRVNL